jgi:hypothetical protein
MTWKCPKCGAKLVVRNLSHACGPYSVPRFLAGKGPAARALFRALVGLVRACGPFDYAPAKTRVAFLVRIRFASVNGLSDRAMRFHFLLKRREDSPRIARIEKIGSWYVHHMRVTRPEELDAEVGRWVAEAYRLG